MEETVVYLRFTLTGEVRIRFRLARMTVTPTRIQAQLMRLGHPSWQVAADGQTGEVIVTGCNWTVDTLQFIAGLEVFADYRVIYQDPASRLHFERLYDDGGFSPTDLPAGLIGPDEELEELADQPY